MRPFLPLVSALVLAVPAHAQTRTDFAVSARIVAGCLIAVDANGALGQIDLGTVPGTARTPVEADLVSTVGTGLSIECTPGTTVSLTADAGQYGVAGNRYLASGANRIPYRLLIGAGSTQWGSQAVPLSFPAGGGSQQLGLRGRAILSGDHAAGTYADTVRVTLTW
jgi:spore coat protein U-like protein